MIVTVHDALVGVVGPVAVGVEGERGGDGRAADREGAGVEHVQRAGLDGGLGSVNGFLGAGCDLGPERGDGDRAGLIALGPVGGELAAVEHGLERLGVEHAPVVGGGGQGGGGRRGEHIDVVAHGVDRLAVVLGGLHRLGRAGGVGVLADDAAAARHQRLSGLALVLNVEPGVGVLHVHVRLGDDGLDAEEEAGVAGDHFRVGERADVADVRVGDEALIHHFLELEAGDEAGDVTGLKGHVERVVEVGQAGLERGVAGHGDELNVGGLLGGLLAVGLVAVGVGDDEVAALLDALDALVVAFLGLGDVVEPHDVGVSQTDRGGRLADAVHMGEGVALVLVADEDDADLQLAAGGLGGRGRLTAAGAGFRGRRRFAAGGGGAIAAAAGDQRERHDEREEQCKVLLHSLFSFPY